MKKYNKYQPLVVEWAKEKGILEHSYPYKQLLKTGEEILELLNALEDNNEEEIKDALGDILVTLIIYAEMKGFELGISEDLTELNQRDPYILLTLYSADLMMEKLNGNGTAEIRANTRAIVYTLMHIAEAHNLNLWECLESAYNVIKHRTGKMQNGTFVKDK